MKGRVQVSRQQERRALGVCAAVFAIWMVMITQSSMTMRPEPVGTVLEAAVAAAEAPQPIPEETPQPTGREDAEELARVVYGTALYCSADAQRAVMWCVINRVESGIYPASVVEVCRQPSQWIGYSGDNPVVERLYDMAVEVLESWESGGHRPIPEGCLWFDLDGTGGIVLRTKFEGGGNVWAVE